MEGCLEVYPLIDSGASQLHYRQTSASLVLPITTTKEYKVGLQNGNWTEKSRSFAQDSCDVILKGNCTSFNTSIQHLAREVNSNKIEIPNLVSAATTSLEGKQLRRSKYAK
ncbi:hypothetical protein A2U01_0003905 [Trifolium medium]|uniref:Uncharacterized protein n=1 Tax=Trifolium medium TaxID=97028 RepID=A0A392M6N0_9FABA|nr:hypothetical protein [Trifolium medium]